MKLINSSEQENDQYSKVEPLLEINAQDPHHSFLNYNGSSSRLHDVNDSSEFQVDSSSENIIKEDVKTPQFAAAQAPKKGKFQLKIPVKAVINPLASKQLEQIIVKNSLSRHNSINDTNNSYLLKVSAQSLDDPWKKLDSSVQNNLRRNNSVSDSSNSYSAKISAPCSSEAWKRLDSGVVKKNDYYLHCNEKNSIKESIDESEFELVTQMSSWSAFGIFPLFIG